MLLLLLLLCVSVFVPFQHRHVLNASGLSWNAGDMDFTGGQMVLTLKLISMAVCFQDAHSKEGEVSDFLSTSKTTHQPPSIRAQQQHACGF